MAVFDLPTEDKQMNVATSASVRMGADRVTSDGVRAYLSARCEEILKVEVYDEVVSTNTLLKARAASGAPAGSVIIANKQTGGKGRLGRSFYSPEDTGLYISALLRPVDMDPAKALSITTIAAVAACEAIEEIDAKPQIKWVNDIILRNRKVAGILTESSIDVARGRIDYAVLGIGFNVYPPKGGFPEEIKNIAGAIMPATSLGEKTEVNLSEDQHEKSDEKLGEKLGEKQSCAQDVLSGTQDVRSQLAAAFLNHFFAMFEAADHEEYAKAYKARSIVLGKTVNVIPTGGGAVRVAHVLDITDDCGLLVQFKDGAGETAVLSTGEVSIRPK